MYFRDHISEKEIGEAADREVVCREFLNYVINKSSGKLSVAWLVSQCYVRKF